MKGKGGSKAQMPMAKGMGKGMMMGKDMPKKGGKCK